ELPRAMDADQLTRRLLDALRAAGEAASAHPPAERMRAEAVLRDIAAGVRFTQQLGNFAAVVQWPVMLNGREATAELYVFGGDSGARGRIDPKNATLFLSLGTANMGRVEVLVKVIGQQVECDFRLPSKEQANFVRSAAPKLGALLEGAGYRLTRSSFIQSLEPAAGPLAVAEARAFFDRRYRFDRQI
ncbi:MAG: flagellar hook-length control protein FliK, partial [Oscillospiraceae bacterium]|nr:flagellar hook-length control protein FliK [Oscillospiraceae bacterium]